MHFRKLAPVVLVLLAAVGCQEEPAERVVDLVVPVTVQPVSRGTIESFISTTGSLRAAKTADILVEVRGELSYVALPNGRKAVEGTRVERGQQIARIESQEYVNSVRLQSRELALQNARNTLTEQRALFEEGLAVQSDVQNAARTVADAEADLADAQIQLEKMKVLAPLSGYLTNLVDTTEETIVEANTVIGQVVDYSQVLTDLKIPNSQMPFIDIGQEVGQQLRLPRPDLHRRGDRARSDARRGDADVSHRGHRRQPEPGAAPGNVRQGRYRRRAALRHHRHSEGARSQPAEP
jgi:multidrug efflux pump subunit AcrA (membrane-fusion protein)